MTERDAEMEVETDCDGKREGDNELLTLGERLLVPFADGLTVGDALLEVEADAVTVYEREPEAVTVRDRETDGVTVADPDKPQMRHC